MFYIWTLDAHEAHGPFLTRARAHAYAKLRGMSSYAIETDNAMQQWQHANLRVVPHEYR